MRGLLIDSDIFEEFILFLKVEFGVPILCWIYKCLKVWILELGYKCGGSNCENFEASFFFGKGHCVLCCLWMWMLNCCFVYLFLWNIFLFSCSMLRYYSVWQCLVFVWRPTLWEIGIIWARFYFQISSVVILHTKIWLCMMRNASGTLCSLLKTLSFFDWLEFIGNW